jgi:hypothetical protein
MSSNQVFQAYKVTISPFSLLGSSHPTRGMAVQCQREWRKSENFGDSRSIKRDRKSDEGDWEGERGREKGKEDLGKETIIPWGFPKYYAVHKSIYTIFSS